MGCWSQALDACTSLNHTDLFRRRDPPGGSLETLNRLLKETFPLGDFPVALYVSPRPLDFYSRHVKNVPINSEDVAQKHVLLSSVASGGFFAHQHVKEDQLQKLTPPQVSWRLCRVCTLCQQLLHGTPLLSFGVMPNRRHFCLVGDAQGWIFATIAWHVC